MGDRFDTFEHIIVKGAHVCMNELDAIEQMTDRRTPPIQTIEDTHLMTGVEQTLAKHGADIAATAGH
jgi:hypothetical protein